MRFSLLLYRFNVFTSFATILGTADFVAFEEATTLEAHKFQPSHLPWFPNG
jgi:hypothetical protein